MLDNQELIDQLVKEILKQYDLEIEGDILVNLTAENDEFQITINGTIKDLKRSQFEEWCNKLDEDIFLETCDKYESLTGKSLKDADDDNDYESFVKVAQHIIKDKIKRLEQYL